MSGTSYALESLEASFQQDLNGDGTIGPTTTVIESAGSTSLTQVADQIYLDDSSGTGPALSMRVHPGPSVSLAVGCRSARSRPQPAMRLPGKLTGADQYTVWNTDSNGNYVSDTIGVVSGTSYALESLETSFQQDLNGDGTIGLTTTVIEFGWVDQPDAGGRPNLS